MSSLKQRSASRDAYLKKKHPEEHFVWSHMRAKCSDPKMAAYKYYGGRGVKVARRWNSFANFYNDMGKKPDDCWIDLKNNMRNFTPANCYWATRKEQNKNRYLNMAMARAAQIEPDLYKILKRAIEKKRRRKKKITKKNKTRRK